MEAETADLVVVGSGVYGLGATKAYLDLNPSAKVVILDSASTIGGVWAKERIYPGLRLNNLLGTYEFSDFPMDEEAFGVKKGEFVPGEATHRYIQAYAEEFGLYSLVRFNTRVDTVQRAEDEKGWFVTCNGPRKGSSSVIFARKLILATGMYSEPDMPGFKDADSFEAPLFHTKELAAHRELIKTANRIAVVGASKSGYDAAYLAASSGAEVDWIIRSSGRGASWIAPPFVTPLKRWLEGLANTRFLTWFNPCIWGDADGYGYIRRFLHGTVVGRWLVDTFWTILGNDVLGLNAYHTHPETQKLKPWSDAFWASASFSILNYPTNVFDYVSNGKIKVHVSDISHLSPRTVHLMNGDSIETDGLVVASGWKGAPSIRFLPEGIDKELGLPREAVEPDEIAAKADEEILNRFPRLRRRPVIDNRYKHGIREVSNPESTTPTTTTTRFRLHRCLVPPAFLHDRSIAFAGMMTNFSTVINAHIQGLWLAAYLSGKLPLETPSAEYQARIERGAALHGQFGKWRYPFGSKTQPDFIFDAVPYFDLLLGDLELPTHRKSGVLAEWFEPYGPADYKGLTTEWKRKHGIE
ncbi:hypothetical protein FQN54_000393 [Arachnomyces sp. PD_36]|nr:hypothetical protein FQN54_000393 [Arachnomyces sp. PD_36]